MVPFALPLTIAAAAGGTWYAWRRLSRPANSKLVTMPELELSPADAAGWDDTKLLTPYLGIPYWYGRGTPATTPAEAEQGLDCSGWAQFALVQLGQLSPQASDRGATALADDCDPIDAGQQKPGDLAIYPGHVMVVTSYPDEEGDSAVMGASNGDEHTLGNDPNAAIKSFTSVHYRNDFICFGRLKANKRGF